MVASTVGIPQRAYLESLRSILNATRLYTTPAPSRGFTIGVTSATYGEGKTTVAMAIAGILSSDFGTEIAIVDVDFETHSLGREYNIQDGTGISDFLSGRTTLTEAMHRVPGTRLDVITTGALPTDPGHLIRSGELARMIADLRERYAYVVLDLPGMLPSSSGRSIADLCDGIVVVTLADRTTRMELDHTLERLEGLRVLGVIINSWKRRMPRWLERGLGLHA